MAIQLLVYCNANAEEGYGHFFRCLNIVRHLKRNDKTISVSFAGEYTDIARQALIQYEIPSYPASLSIFLNDTYKTALPDFRFLLLDTYLIDQSKLDLLFSKYKVLLLDDFNLYKTEKAYGIINFTINAPNFSYNASFKMLGLDYFPYRLELESVRNQNLLTGKNEMITSGKKIVLFFSGKQMDTSVLIRFMNCMDRYFHQCSFRLIGNLSESYQMINNSFEMMPYRIDIEEYYKEADLIISGGGLVKYEAAFCAIPNLSAAVTKEQHQESLNFQKNNLTFEISTLYDFNESYCLERLKTFFEDSTVYKNMMEASKEKFSFNKLGSTIRETIA